MKLIAVTFDPVTNELIPLPSHIQISLITEEEFKANGVIDREYVCLSLPGAIDKLLNLKEELRLISEKMNVQIDEVLVPVCECDCGTETDTVH